jgi:integrase/recombinase XerD
MELPMTNNSTVSPLRQRMIEDMVARKLNPHTQRSHIHSCKRFAAYLKRSPDTATPDDVRAFQLHLIESGASICNRNRIMTGVRFLSRPSADPRPCSPTCRATPTASPYPIAG